jgi:hypothetical protein
MKKIIVMLVIFVISMAKINAQDIPPADNLLIDKYINSILTIDKVKLSSDTLAKVFEGAFYEFSPIVTMNNSVAACGTYKVLILNGQLSLIEDVGTTIRLDNLLPLVREDFSIKNEGDAKIFETALDYIYPITWDADLKDKKFFEKDGKWYFIRGDFFDNKKGFVITLDANSKISAIDFDLKAIKKPE